MYIAPAGNVFFGVPNSSAALIAAVTLPQAVSSLGFIGFTSTTPIAYITTTVDRGWQVDTAYDNLRIGFAVPEPESAWLWLVGLAGVAGLNRQRTR